MWKVIAEMERAHDFEVIATEYSGWNGSPGDLMGC
jgi:hypothetical protein